MTLAVSDGVCTSASTRVDYVQVEGPPPVPLWSSDPAVNLPVVSTTGDQRAPAACPDGAGGAITAWVDQGTIPATIRVQRVDGLGGLRWASEGIPLGVDGTGAGLGIVSDGVGGAVVVWRDGSALMARRVDATGTPKWPATALAPLIGGTPLVLVTDGASGAIAVWEEGTSDRIVRAQSVDSAGAVRWGASGVPVTPSSDDQGSACAVADGTGGVIVAWRQRSSGDRYVVRVQRLGADGSRRWTESELLGHSDRDDRPAIVSDGSGGVYVAWGDQRLTDRNLYAQRFTATGWWYWQNLGVCIVPGLQTEASMAPDGQGGAIVAWSDARNGARDIYAQRIRPNATVAWREYGEPLCIAGGDQARPLVAATPAGGATVVWSDGRAGADLYGVRVGPGGSIGVGDQGGVITHAAGAQTNPAGVATGSGDLILVWEDGRASGLDLYAQHTGYVLCDPQVAADFSASPTTGRSPFTVQFTDLSIGPVTEWAWDFENDGVIDATIPNPTHVYTALDTFTVSLTVSDGTCAHTKTSLDLVKITGCEPAVTAGFSASDTTYGVPFTVQFTDQSLGPVTRWAWDFENDGSSTRPRRIPPTSTPRSAPTR